VASASSNSRINQQRTQLRQTQPSSVNNLHGSVATSSLSPVEMNLESESSLIEMGFREAQVRKALRLSNDNVEKALDLLLTMSCLRSETFEFQIN